MIVSLGVDTVGFSSCSGVKVATQQHISLGLEMAYFCVQGVEELLIVIGRFMWGSVGCTQVYIFFPIRIFFCSVLSICGIDLFLITVIFFFSSALFHTIIPPESLPYRNVLSLIEATMISP